MNMKQMKLLKSSLLTMAVSMVLLSSLTSCSPSEPGTRWTEQQAREWYSRQGWLSGCDYIPATAINQIEMWSKDTYDEAQIDKELTWAEDLGFKTLRVYLSSVVYQNDPSGMKKRMGQFLDVCRKHGIRPLFVFFDDCWNEESQYGQQPQPKPGIHNSGWVQDPSVSVRKDTAAMYASLEKYVRDIVKTFGQDDRILLWDLYNEPGNSGHLTSSLPLLRKAFEWARAERPTQPLTAGLWNWADEYAPLNALQIENSDVISYHNYGDSLNHRTMIKYLTMLNRPLVCTEYMARTQNSTFQTILPMLKEKNVVAINWGFVQGKTNTIYQWSTPIPDGSEPALWFHDILRPDGTPYIQNEVNVIRALNGK